MVVEMTGMHTFCCCIRDGFYLGNHEIAFGVLFILKLDGDGDGVCRSLSRHRTFL